MNKELDILKNQNYGFMFVASFETSDFFQINIHKHLSLIGEVFFIGINPNDWIKLNRIYVFLAKYSCSIDKELRHFARHEMQSKYKRDT